MRNPGPQQPGRRAGPTDEIEKEEAQRWGESKEAVGHGSQDMTVLQEANNGQHNPPPRGDTRQGLEYPFYLLTRRSLADLALFPWSDRTDQ